MCTGCLENALGLLGLHARCWRVLQLWLPAVPFGAVGKGLLPSLGCSQGLGFVAWASMLLGRCLCGVVSSRGVFSSLAEKLLLHFACLVP